METDPKQKDPRIKPAEAQGVKLPAQKIPPFLPEPVLEKNEVSIKDLEDIILSRSKITGTSLSRGNLKDVKLLSDFKNLNEAILSFSNTNTKGEIVNLLLTSSKLYRIEKAPTEDNIQKYRTALTGLVSSIQLSNNDAALIGKKYPQYITLVQQLVSTNNPNFISMDSLPKEVQTALVPLIKDQENIRNNTEKLLEAVPLASRYTLTELNPLRDMPNKLELGNKVVLVKIPDKEGSPWLATYDSSEKLLQIETGVTKNRQTFTKEEILNCLKYPQRPENIHLFQILKNEPYLATELSPLWKEALNLVYNSEQKAIAYSSSTLLHLAASGYPAKERAEIIDILLPNKQSHVFYNQLIIQENSSPISPAHLGNASFAAVEQVIKWYNQDKSVDNTKHVLNFFAQYPDRRALDLIRKISTDPKLKKEITFAADIVLDMMEKRSIEEIKGRVTSLNQDLVKDIERITSSKNISAIVGILNLHSNFGELIRPAISELIDSNSGIHSVSACLLALSTKDREMVYRAINKPGFFDNLSKLSVDNKDLYRIFMQRLKFSVDAGSPAARHLLILAANHPDPTIRSSFQPLKISESQYSPGAENELANFKYSFNGAGINLLKEAIALKDKYRPDNWQSKALDRFIKTRSMGWDFPDRLLVRNLNGGSDNWQGLIEDSSSQPAKGQKVAVLLASNADSNGAGYGIGTIIAELKKKNYHIEYREVGSKAELVAKAKNLSSNGKQADLLFIFGHSYKEQTFFGNTEWLLPDTTASITTNDTDELSKSGLKNLLKENGSIILCACSTGQGKKGADNIANMMRTIFPKAQEKGIWSMTEPGNIESLIFDKDGILQEVKFWIMNNGETYRAALDEDHSKYLNIS